MHINDERGFTLMEMLIVLFIIGIIIAIAVPNFLVAGKKAQERSDLANRRLIGSQVENYYLDHGIYPDSVEQLCREGYLRSIPRCADGKREFVIDKREHVPSEERVTCG